MKKQLTALVLCICMVLSVLPFSGTQTAQAAAEETSSVGASNISIGDYISLGTYNGQPILWRCVDIDELGPLMLSDQVLATMAYDAKTSENSATRSHSRNLKRGAYGSNQWRDSNMRSWLNSKAEAGKVDWLCGNPPKSGFVGENPYDQAAGFLNGFQEDEIAAIKTVTQRSIVSHPEYNAGMIEGQGADLPYDTNIASAANGFDQAYYENVTDKVFLMDVKQINKVYQNNSQLGDSYHIAYKDGIRWPCWLRTPVTDCNHDMRYVETDGRIDRNAPYLGFYGVRPAFYLDTKYYQVTGGNGTAASPYRGAAVNKPEENFIVSGDGPTAGQEWDVPLDKTMQLYLGPNYSKSKKYESTTIPIQVIQKTRSDNENMVVVICGEGYTKGQQRQFVADAKRLWDGAMQYEPYKSYKDRFNVYALCTASDKTYRDQSGYDSTFFDVLGQNISVNGSTWKNHIFERCIGPAFIEKVHDAHIPQQTDPNVDGDYEKYKYVHDYISQFVLLVNSAKDFGGASNNLESGFHYIVSPAYSSRAVKTFTHELGHGLLWLGDEYNSGSFMGEAAERTSLNRTVISNPEQVKWKQLLGFRKTYSVPHTDYDTDKIYNSSRECMMRWTDYDFCEVCKLQGNKRMSQLVTDGPDLYVAEPEVTKYTGAYTKLSDFSDATGSGYTKFDADKKSRLLTGAGKIAFRPTEMKGQEIELRTIVQNLSDTKLSQVTLQVWVNHADGTIATANGQPVAASETFKIPLWTDKSKFRPKGTLEYHGSDFDSGLKNCSLLYTIPSNADLKTGDTVGYAVRDEQGKVLAYEGTLPDKGQDLLPTPKPAKSYTVTFCYNDGRINTTKTTGINGKLADLPAPTRKDYVFDGWYTANGTGGEKVDLTRTYDSDTTLFARWNEYIAPSPAVKKTPTILLTASQHTVTEGEQVVLSVRETSGFGVDLRGVTYTADPHVSISGSGSVQTIRLGTAGRYTFTAHYSGDNEKYLASDSNSVTVTVTKKTDISGGTSYTVTFCYNDGRTNTTKTTGINGKLGDLPAPTRKDYVFDGWYTTDGEKVDLTRKYDRDTMLFARWSEYIAPSPTVKKTPTILLTASPHTVTEGEQVVLSVRETSGFGVDLRGVTYTADPHVSISGSGSVQTIRLGTAGRYTFTAHYSGDNEKYLASDSNSVTVTVTKKADISGGTPSGGGAAGGGAPAGGGAAGGGTPSGGGAAGGGAPAGGGAAAGGAPAGGGAATGNTSATTTPDIKDADGTTADIVQDKTGMLTAKVQLSEKAIANAEQSGEAVKLPVEVKAGKNIESASTVTINLPERAGKTKVKIPVKNMTTGTVAVLVKADGTEEIVKKSVAAKDGVQLIVDEDTTVKLIDKAKNFKDTKKHWAKDSIDFVSARGLMNGKSSTAFAPEAKITRAQIWTILARWDDVDLTGGKKWYSKARAWAKSQGITGGSRPNAVMTRAEVITMLWRAQGKPAAEQETAFKDVSADEYYARAVAWAKEKGITQANNKGRFNPDAACTRAETAAFLYRMSLSE